MFLLLSITNTSQTSLVSVISSPTLSHPRPCLPQPRTRSHLYPSLYPFCLSKAIPRFHFQGLFHFKGWFHFQLDLALSSRPMQLHAASTPLTSSTTGHSLALIQPLATPYNISNFSAIHHIKRSVVVHTLKNLVASVKLLVPIPPTQDNVSKSPTPSRLSATITFLNAAVRISPIPKWPALSAPKNLIQTAPVLPLVTAAFSNQGI